MATETQVIAPRDVTEVAHACWRAANYRFAPPGWYQATPPGTNIMAILSLVFAFVFAPAGIVLGHIAKRQLRTSGEGGGGLATAGLILSYIFTALWVLFCAGIIILTATTNHTT